MTGLEQEKERLLKQLKRYESMEQHVKMLKEGYSELFMKVSKAEQQKPENQDVLKRMEELVNELKAREIEVMSTLILSIQKGVKIILYVG